VLQQLLLPHVASDMRPRTCGLMLLAGSLAPADMRPRTSAAALVLQPCTLAPADMRPRTWPVRGMRLQKLRPHTF
jgi:hypothetical protein